MSISREEKKARTKAKNKLINNLSLVQLLYLANKNNLEENVNIDGGIYEYRIANVLSENIPLDDINSIIEKANSMSDDLSDLELELRLLSKKELKIILRDVDKHIPSSFDFLINAIFLFISLDDIRNELDSLIVVSKDKDKMDDEDFVSVVESRNIAVEEMSTEKNPSADIEEPNEIIHFELDSNNVKDKLFEYDLEFLCDILLNNFNINSPTGLTKEEILNFKDLEYEWDDFTEEEQNERLSIEKEKLIKIILDSIPIDVLNEEYFNPIAYEFFPYGNSFKEPRLYQIETISQIYNAIQKGYKFIFLEACSGFGKSLIAATVSRIYSKEKSYILTPTNQLITPYEKVFKDYSLKKVKARSFFTCKRSGKICSYNFCNESDCGYYKNLNLNRQINPKGTCNYLYQLYEGLESDAIVCTYNYFFTEAFREKNFLNKRKLIICDESHNIDNLASSGSKLMLFETTLKQIGLVTEEEYGDIKETEDYYFFLIKTKHYYEEFLNKHPVSNQRKRYEKDLVKLTNFLSYFKEGDNNIAFEYIEEENKNNKWIFSPINAKQFVSDVLFDYSEVCIFMSSSIFDYEIFAYDLGIKEEDVFKLTVPPIFDLSNNPIKVYNKFNMGSDNYEDIKYKTLPIIDEILLNHKFEKGIIHTFNNDIKKFLYENLSNNRRLLTHTTENRESQLEKFKKSPHKLVFISSSMDEGVDLPGDLCRFQIIYKLPFPNNQDERIINREKTYEDGTDWYVYKMLTKLIQAYGRGIRFEGDYCKTYLLDNRIWEVVDEDDYGRIIPKYFLDVLEEYGRFEEIENVPEEDEDDNEDLLEDYLKDYL